DALPISARLGEWARHGLGGLGFLLGSLFGIEGGLARAAETEFDLRLRLRGAAQGLVFGVETGVLARGIVQRGALLRLRATGGNGGNGQGAQQAGRAETAEGKMCGHEVFHRRRWENVAFSFYAFPPGLGV